MNPFEGELVRLAPISRENLPAFTRWFRDYEVQRFLAPGVLVPITDEAEEEWYEQASRPGESYHFSIRTLADDELIGNCGLIGIDHKNGGASLGLYIGEKEQWDKGFGTDATRLILRFAFNELNLHRVQLQVYEYNPRAVRVYEKVGFVHEGVRRQALFREGQYHDVRLMAILRDEWRALQDRM